VGATHSIISHVNSEYHKLYNCDKVTAAIDSNLCPPTKHVAVTAMVSYSDQSAKLSYHVSVFITHMCACICVHTHRGCAAKSTNPHTAA